jgi:hypothetical protein
VPALADLFESRYLAGQGGIDFAAIRLHYAGADRAARPALCFRPRCGVLPAGGPRVVQRYMAWEHALLGDLGHAEVQSVNGRE